MTEKKEINYLLEKLLNGVEVEWKMLGEVAEIGTGSSNRQDEDDNGIYPFYVRSKTVLKSRSFQFDETAIIVPGEGGIGDIFHYVEGRYALHQRAYRIHIITSSLNEKFLYYLMTSQFKQYILSKSVGSTSISIRKPMIEKFPIPIPPLPVQQKIVQILDAFTAMTAELTAELSLRTQQYQYYRDKLLTFSDDEVEWKTLGEVAIIGTGSRNTNESVINGKYPFYVRSQEPRLINEYEFDETAIITAGDGVGVGKVFHYVVGKYALHQRAYRIVVKDNIIIPKFIFYFIRHNFLMYLSKISVHASVTSLRKPMFDKYPIPIPSLAEQERIVAILDKFDTLTHSISEGLPREIELRQKQYEYYRDKLLDFPKPKGM